VEASEQRAKHTKGAFSGPPAATGTTARSDRRVRFEQIDYPPAVLAGWRWPWHEERRMDDKVNLAEKLERLDRPYLPGIVGYLNDYKVIVVKVLGEFVWHKHDDTDDFFLVLRGRLTIQLRDRDIEPEEGEMFVVPRGVEHCPKADEEAHVLLIEPRDTLNTGDAGGELTAEPVEI
jgi:mannose-6-phosphate isomerase-like protein (cupin superfamily)